MSAHDSRDKTRSPSLRLEVLRQRYLPKVQPNFHVSRKWFTGKANVTPTEAAAPNALL